MSNLEGHPPAPHWLQRGRGGEGTSELDVRRWTFDAFSKQPLTPFDGLAGHPATMKTSLSVRLRGENPLPWRGEAAPKQAVLGVLGVSAVKPCSEQSFSWGAPCQGRSGLGLRDAWVGPPSYVRADGPRLAWLHPVRQSRAVHPQRRREENMLSRFRHQYEDRFLSFGRKLVSLGLTPNVLTILGLLAGGAAGAALWRGWFFAGVGLALLSVLLDMADGAAARGGGTAWPMGEVYDHLADRYVEFCIVLGVVGGGHVPGWLGLSTAFGMVMASYARVKAESKYPQGNHTFGLMERQEKLGLLLLGCVAYGISGWRLTLLIPVGLAGFLSHVTVVQRLLHARRIAGAAVDGRQARR
jgi:phosphatidylglycerophosphate synthase